MSNGVYRKYATRADGDDRKYALNADGDNRIDLSAEEQLALHDALNAQIVQHKISGLTQEIVHVVFHKTIRLNKREDDINGTCLSNLTSTGSRSDYVNGHVRELIANSVIIARLGHYGRILSINYNFEQWGHTPEYNRENGGLISDPEALLQSLEIPTKTEDRSLSAAEEDSACQAPHENPVSNAAALQVQDTALSVNALSALLADNIPANLALLITEDMIKQGLQKIVEFVTALFKESPIFELISKFIAPQTQAETAPESTIITENPAASPSPSPSPSPNPSPSPETEKTTANQTAIETVETPKSAEKQADIAVADIAVIKSPEIPEHPTQSEQKPSVIAAITAPESPQTQAYEQLNFPAELKPYEQNQIICVLEKEAVSDLDTVQAVLDSMSSRFQVAMEPIKSPIAYFRSLLNCAKTDAFDRSYAEIYQKQSQEKAQQEGQATEKQKSREAIDKYNEAKNNYAKLELYLEHTDKSMRQLAKDLGWLDVLEEMGFDLGAEIAV